MADSVIIAVASVLDLSGWTNDELLEWLHNVGDRLITKDTRDVLKKSKFTGQHISDFFKDAWGSRNPQQAFRDSLENQLGNLRIKPEQTDQLWQKLNEILIAAADSEITNEAAASEDLHLAIKVLRWMYVKDARGSSKYVAYELQVTAPFASEAGALREMDTRTYLQRWSQMSRFNDTFKAWAQKTAKIAGTPHMFQQQISWKMFRDLSDPRALETRKMELNDYLSKLAHWANDAADKRLINLPTLIDEVVEPCFGADPGGRSPMGKRTSENLQETDQVYAGWLNLVRNKKSEPFHVVLARAAVDVKGKESRSVGCELGTFALYHGPKDRHAESAIPLPGVFITGCEEVGAESADRSPKEMHGLHQFALHWHQPGTDRRGNSTLQLQKYMFNTGDEEIVEEWVRRCRRQQRESFGEWSDAELGKWMQATGAFGDEEPLVDCGIDAASVVEHVLNDESRQLKRALSKIGLHRDRFGDLWSKLLELLVNDLGTDLADRAQDSPASTSKDEQFYLHVLLDIGWTRKDLGGFVFTDGFVVEKIKKRTAAGSAGGACEGMQLVRIKGSGLEKPIQLQSLSFAAGMAQLAKAFAALDDDSSLTLIFKLPWQKLNDERHDTYFWNEYTDATTWDAPEEVTIAEEATKRRRAERDLRRSVKVNPISPWVGYFSEDSGDPYFVREDTEESVWEAPRVGISRWGDGNTASADVEEATEDGDAGSIAQGELLPPESGELTVKVVRCRDLVAADAPGLGGLSDPYVKLALGGKHYYETECQRNTVDPDFNVDALFPVSAEDSRDALKLRVEVWDWNKGRQDGLLGMVELSLPSEFAHGWTDNTHLSKGKLFQLKDPASLVDSKAVVRKRELIANRSSRDRQKIKALLTGLDKKASSFDKDNLYGAIFLELSFEPGQGKTRRPGSTGRVQVTEISCRQILPTSSSDMSTTYCEFWLANKPKNKRVTGSCKKTLDPRWFEEPEKPWEFVVTENAEEDLTLHAQIKSKSSGSLLGQCKIDLTREFADGWTANAKPTAKALLSDPYGEVRQKDIDRVRKPQFKGSECATEDLYGSINITLIFRQDEMPRDSLALASIPSALALSDIRPTGILSLKILSAKGGFLTDERTNRREERQIYFQVAALKDGADVLPTPKRSKMLSMGTSQELQIKDRHLSRTTFELESQKGRPDVIRVLCLQESDDPTDVPMCLGVCEIDIRHKSEEAWISRQDSSSLDYAPKVQGAHFAGAEYTGVQDDVTDRFRLEEERCTVLREDMTPHGDDCERILREKRRQEDDQRRRRRSSPAGRGRRGSETSRATGEPLNWLKVSMSWTPADTPATVERATDVTGVWHATMNMMPTGEGTDYDVKLNPYSPWVGIWQDGKPFFFNERTRKNLEPEQEEPDEGIKEWKMRPGTMTGPDKEKKRKGKHRTRKRHSPQQRQEFFFLYQQTHPGGCIVIGGHEADVQVTSEDRDDVEWHGAEPQQRFTIRNARLVDDQLMFDMVRESEDGLFSKSPPEVTRWEANLNFASRRLYNGKISGAKCGTFEATRPPTHKCQQTCTIPLHKLCPELTMHYSSFPQLANCVTNAPARTISLRPATGNAEKREVRLEPAVEERLKFSKDVADSVRKLARPDDSLTKSDFKSAKKSLQRQAFRPSQDDAQVALLEANSDTVATAVEISKQRHKRGWMGSLHVVSEQAVDWKFTLRAPTVRSLEVIIETLELDDTDLDGRKIWCAVGRPYKSANKAHAETRKLEPEDGVVEWRDPNDRPVLKFLEPEDPSYCLVDICTSSRTLGTVRVPIPKYKQAGEETEEDFEETIESDDIAGTLSGYIRCTYEHAECNDSLDLSLWFCQSGQQLAREVVPRHRCFERSGTFTSHTAGQLLYLVEDELWNPVRVAGAHSAPPCKGTFSVTVIRARDLIAADPTGQSDPYVKLRMLNTSFKDEQERKTGVVKRQLNPTFNEQFDFEVDTDGSLELHVEVWDQDVLEQDDFLGEVKIPLADVMNAGANSERGMAWLLRPPAPMFYQLEDPEERAAEDQAKYCVRRRGEPLGAIQLAFGFFLSQVDRKPPPAEQGILSITLEQCLDLLPAKMDPRPSSQPFVRFKCGKESKQSKVCEEASLSPEWHGADGRYQLAIGQDMESQQDLEVEVYSNERPTKMLGCCIINLPTLFYHGWEESDPPTLVHQLGPTTKDGKEKANYECLVDKRKIMKNPDRTVTNVDNPENEYGAIRMKVEYSRSRGRHSPGRNRWSSSRKSDEVIAPPAGTLRVVAARAHLQHKPRESYLSLRIWVDERKKTQQATEVEMTRTEGRSKLVHWNQPMEFDVPQGEQRLRVEIFECLDSSGSKPTLLDTGDLEFSMISGQGYDPVNLESGDVGLAFKVHYMATGMTGIWKAEKDDEDGGEIADFMLLKEAKDGRITGSCVWDDGDEDFEPFDIPSGERDRDTNWVTFEQRHFDGDGSVDWKANLCNSELQEGEYDNGTFTAKQLPNTNSKVFRLELTAEQLDSDRLGQPSRESIHKAHIKGVSRRLHHHCEQRGVRKPSQMRHRMMALQNLPPTPLALDTAYAMYGLALDENAEQEPQMVDPGSLGLWKSKSQQVDDDAFNMPFEELNEEFKALLKQERTDTPRHQRYCNAGEHGLSENLPPPPWLLDSAERAAMAELNHNHEHVVERKIKDVLHAGAQLALKVIGATVSQIRSISDRDDADDDNSDTDDPEPEVETGRTRRRVGRDDSGRSRSRSREDGTAQLLYTTRTRARSDSDGQEDKFGSPPPSPKDAGRRSRSPSSADRRTKRGGIDEGEQTYSEGDVVEVFSKSAQEWLEAEVISANDGLVKVQYSKGGQDTQKTLAIDSVDLRRLARPAASRSSLGAPSARLTLSPAKGVGKSDTAKWKDVTVNNHTSETLMLHFDEGKETEKVKKGKSVLVQMRKFDEIWATANDETVWGPETLGRDKEFTIDGDLMSWTGSAGSSPDSRERSRTKRTSEKKKKKRGSKSPKSRKQ